eukprot:1177689-Prorocentrum_minimum.AAC.4
MFDAVSPKGPQHPPPDLTGWGDDGDPGLRRGRGCLPPPAFGCRWRRWRTPYNQWRAPLTRGQTATLLYYSVLVVYLVRLGLASGGLLPLRFPLLFQVRQRDRQCISVTLRLQSATPASQYSTVQYSTVQHSTVWYGAVQVFSVGESNCSCLRRERPPPEASDAPVPYVYPLRR